MRFLLDTDTVSFALRDVGNVKERLLERVPSEIAVSVITTAELRFGAHKRGSRKLHRLLDAFFSSVNQIAFDSHAAERYGEVAAQLQKKGEKIGIADTLIAAHALELELTLVTHNIRHFKRVRGLEIVDWA